jgi:hypothetical protein
VLDDPGYRTRAREFQAEILALPGADRVVELVTGLAFERVPAA